ncbi:MAG TPA: DEAD/DEAH box helicase, partial [Edaphobacter sp.]|nr:DEAD/DEAH box helicase [Edaphobacter sp.]
MTTATLEPQIATQADPGVIANSTSLSSSISDSIPVRFTNFDISDSLKNRLTNAGFTIPTPVQAKAIPPALGGADILATASTGTGKTLSFLVPIIERMDATSVPSTRGKRGPIRALIL